MDITLLIFGLVYLSMAFGHLPGFKVDRTGAAVVGAMLLVVLGRISASQAWAAIDYTTIGMLFGLMVISSGFVVSGFYAWVAYRVGTMTLGPGRLLAVMIAVAGGLSALLTNDVVVVAMTPLLVKITLSRGLNPIPFLLGFCFAANTGSAGTIIGSPQNMIAAQSLGLSFTGYLRVALLPALISLPIVWAVLVLLYRRHWHLAGVARHPAPDAIRVDHYETWKTALVTLAVIAAFVLSPWPRELIALCGASVLLVNRQVASADMMKHVDGNLLLMLMGLFVVNAALSATGLPQKLLADLQGWGLSLQDPVSLLLAVSALSNVVGNNPAVMLLVPFLGDSAQPEALGAALALGTGFSSNIVVFGSLAGIIVMQESAAQGIKISFAEFARAGIPVALCCLVVAAAWVLMLTG